MLQDPISKPPDVQMEGARAGADRRNKPNNANPEQVLKCPRCDSLNTKFCYYNNYSLTQPRHFCKNCRRYWTQGGSLRNVPIGGGCRKNKRVKQRTVDPHMFGGLDDHGFLQHAGGSAGGLLSSSCFGGPGGSGSVPGFGDLMPSNDSHLLSMAFSRLQESLRLGEHTAPNNSAGKLSLMGHSSPLYDNASCGLVSNYSGASNVKPEHVYNNVNATSSDQLGCNLFDPSSTSSHLGSATASLASLEDQLTNFGVPNMVDAFNSCSLEAQLKLQHQKQLALHLGAASDHHNMPSTDPTNTSSSNGGSSVVENGRAHPHAAHHHHQHRHHALPDFEDHESPESMSSIMMRRGHAAASKGKVMSMGIDGRGQLLESWQQGGGAGHEGNMNNMLQAAQAQQQHGGGEQQMNLYHESVISASAAHAVAGDQQMSFWSPSPWTDHHVHTQLAGSTAGALL